MNKNTSTGIAYRWLLAMVFTLYVTAVYAQKPQPPDTIGASYAEALDKSYSLSNELFLASLEDEAGEKKLLKYYKSTFKDIFETLHEAIKDRQMAYIPAISAGLENIVKEIQLRNPGVPADIRLVLVRDNIPNAYTLGDNTLFVNIGIFYYLQTEDQVAGVLCHEIGHLLRRHTIKSIKYRYEKDKEAATDIKSINEYKDKKADRALEALRTIIYKHGGNSRKYELQADSIGYVLLKNTKYQPAAFTNALKITDRYDTIRPDGLLTETYRRFFDLPSQKFRETWMKVEDFTSYNYNAFTEKFDKDSTSSHPVGKERVAHLVHIFPELNRESKDTAPTETFKKMKQAAEMERIPNLFVQEQYGEAVYVSLCYLQENPNDAFYRNWLGQSFQKIYEGRKNYKLNKYLDIISPKEQSQSYIQFLSFMWNLKLDEIKKIAEYYCKACQ